MADYWHDQHGTPATPKPAVTVKKVTATPRASSGGGSSMPPSNQVKKIVPSGKALYGQAPNTAPTITGNVKQPGTSSALPPGSPMNPPRTGPGTQPITPG